MEKVGIALSGGGVVGCAHLGVLLALEEAGIRIDCLAGTSSGAIVAALYAYGYTARELIDLLPSIGKQYLDYDYLSLICRLILRGAKIRGLIKGEKLRGLIADKTDHTRMPGLKLPAALLATDLKTGRQVIFASCTLPHGCPDADIISDIPVADAVQASFAIPVLFRPVIHKDRVLADGGIVDNCPVGAVRALGANRVIAVNLAAADPVSSSLDSLPSILTRTISINLASQARQIIRDADIVLHPEVGGFGVLDFSRIPACVERGYEHTRRRIREIKDALATGHPFRPALTPGTTWQTPPAPGQTNSAGSKRGIPR